MRCYMYMEWCFATKIQQTAGLFEQGFPRRRSVGHYRAIADSNVQAIRQHSRRVAEQRQTSGATERICLHYLRGREKCALLGPGLHH